MEFDVLIVSYLIKNYILHKLDFLNFPNNFINYNNNIYIIPSSPIISNLSLYIPFLNLYVSLSYNNISNFPCNDSFDAITIINFILSKFFLYSLYI